MLVCSEHLEILSTRISSSNILLCHEVEFPSWFKDKLVELRSLNDPKATDELYYLALGPDADVQLHDACVVNGIRYHTKSRDASRACQNSGVSVSSSDDGANLEFFGKLKDVVLMFYGFRYKVQLFWCDWYRCNPTQRSIVHEFGLTCIDTSKIWYEDDPFILATQARQVYYVDDIKRGGNWKVVIKVQHRGIYEVLGNENEVEGSSESDRFESLEYNEPNQESSSNEASMTVCEELEVSELCRIDVQPQHVVFPDSQLHVHELFDEDGDDELYSDEDQNVFISDDYSD